MAMDDGKGSGKQRLMKKVIREIAEEKKLSKFQYYKIQNWEIWVKIVDLGYDRFISRSRLKQIRQTLPKGYYNNYK